MWVIGGASLLWCGINIRAAHNTAQKTVAVLAATSASATDTAAIQHPQDGAVLGRLDIPALKLSVPFVEGYSTDDLRHGLGHIEGTAYPGGLGTVALAGHRDTFLRPLRNVKPGMRIALEGTRGIFYYQVDRTEIVDPDAVRVLDTVNTPELVLVTCYPFYYVGSAPQRFIVHAHLLSLTPALK